MERRRRAVSALALASGACAVACGAYSVDGVGTPVDAAAPDVATVAAVEAGTGGLADASAARGCGWDPLEARFDVSGIPGQGWYGLTPVGSGVTLAADATEPFGGVASLRVDPTGATQAGPGAWYRRMLTSAGSQRPGCLSLRFALRRAAAWAPSGAVALGITFGPAILTVGFDALGSLEIAEKELDGDPYVTLGKASVPGGQWIPVVIDVDLARGTVASTVDGKNLALGTPPSLIRGQSPSHVEVGALWTGGRTSTFWIDELFVQ